MMICPARREKLAALGVALLLGLALAAQPATAQFKCFPSCSPADARFLVIASGTGLVTLSEETLDVQFAVQAGAGSFSLGLFDGDGGGLDALGKSHWDLGSNIPYRFTLYADPLGNGTGTTVIEMLPGFPSVSSLSMPNNAWIDYTVAVGPEAQSPSGNHFYRLHIELLDNSVASYNSFKIRTTGVVSIELAKQPFSYIAALRSQDEARIVYPNFPTLSPTTYDGVFQFFFDIPQSLSQISVWDGDFDRGSYDGTNPDTDDPDTPGAPFLPEWATVDSVPEGVAVGLGASTGNPPDDLNPNAATLRRTPAIREDLLFPDGQIFSNENPSGNQEWEQFLISTDELDPSLTDASASVIPAGTYELRITGVDMGNLNAVRLPAEALCVSETFQPCIPLRPFLVGDSVFRDCDSSGTQENESGLEPGLAGIVIELVDEMGNVIATTVTDENGNYSFPAEALPYTIRVADSNFEPGGPLEGHISTTGTSKTEIVVDDNVLTYDFGFCGTGSLGDRVWLDVDGDGIQDPEEEGIAEIYLELLDGDGNVIDQTFTGFEGEYTFPNVNPGTYTVRIDPLSLPAGLTPSADLDGTATPHEAVATLAAGQDRTDVDFGYTGGGNASIGDRLWADADGDGVQDAGEEGLPGVTVRLLDGGGNEVATTVSGADGLYLFEGLSAGTYTVAVDASTLPAGLVATHDLDGLTTLNTATVTVEAEDARTDVDFGYRGTASLGDRVWYDINANGTQDGGETGFTGVTVQLLDAGNNVVASTETAAGGLYSFTNLLAGTYTVRVDASTLPAGTAQTFDLDGTGSAHTATVSLAGGAARTDVDFGYRGTGALGDRIWYDIDGDAIQDATESGISGVTVELVDGGGNVIATTTTDANGAYSFGNLVAGSYTVRVAATTLPGEGAPTFDLDGIATPDTAAVPLAAGQTRDDVDFGYRGTGALGDRVWYDIDGNGTQDAGEAGLNGVTVELLDGSGDVLLTTTTSGDGSYSFAGLFPGTYSVRVVSATLPGGAVATYDLDGTATANIATATLASGQNLSTVDFGYRGSASLGDRVWLDLSGNGAQDAGEPGLSNVAVELVDGSGNVLASSSTTSGGLYGFANLLAGPYTVRVVSSTLPGGLIQTYDIDGTATANTAALTLAAGDARTDVDFGYRGTLQFGDRVWFDYDGNGIQDTGEPGIPSVTIELRDTSGTLISTTITGANGNYTFYNLPPGTYTVTIVTSTLPGGSVPTYDLDGTATANTAVVALAAGQSRTDVDFGYRGTASLGDRVWLDYDADGVQDAGEAGLNGVTVQLLDDNNNVIASTATAGDGNYSFPNLLAGTYKVRVVTSTLMPGAIRTYDLDGTGTAHIATAAVAAGQARTDADFGYRVTAPGTGTIGYWKNHPQAWPVSTITIGGVVYTRDQAIVLIGTPSRGDKTIDLFKQLVASKLSVLVGNNPSCIYQTIASADAWLAAHPPGSGVGSSSSAWTQASPWHTQLDNYNNGNLCAPHRG